MPVDNIKVYLGLLSIFNSEAKINMVNIISKEIEISELKKIVIQMKPSNLNSFINNRIENDRNNEGFDLTRANNALEKAEARIEIYNLHHNINT